MKFFPLFLFVFGFSVLSAQTTEGTVKYKQTTYFDNENLPADAPKSMEIAMRLKFSKASSLYEKDPDVVEVENPEDNTPRMFRRMRNQGARTYYKNLSEGKVLEQISFFGKDFLVTDTVSNIKWKVSAGEQKIIQGYTCMKATYKDSLTNLVAFFTPQIPVSTGPEKYGKLPGLILEIQSAKMHIIATEINKTALEAPIEAPSKGEKMTQEAFKKLRDEKMKEQREMWGGQGPGRRMNRQ